ncbi:MAG TPA: phosphatidate cytidylyltransferase [Fimbriiglobus sp.]|nr:phosphatidate cytidylyltransferase [Fimbriiglobus sp.]
MNPVAQQRLFDPTVAFDHPATPVLLGVIAAALAIPPVVLFLAGRLGLMPADRRRDVWRRYLPWLVIAPAAGAPVLLGAFWTVLAVAALGSFCFREYARATGLFREKLVTYLTLLAMALVYLAALDNWLQLFHALFPLGIAGIVALSILQDRPKGYIQRAALAVFAFALFGSCLGHLAHLANDTHYRPLLLLVLLTVAVNDVAAFIAGRLFGRRKLCPNTSPNKTVAGAVGAAAVTALVMWAAGRWVFTGTPLDHTGRLIAFGVLVSVAGQFGDLVLSSIKRDLGLKDLDVLIPGHGGLLDRFDSLLLVAPVAFHFVNYFVGVGVGQPVCVFTGAR